MERQVREIAYSLQNRLIEIRREIHKNPELSLKEYDTSKFIVKVLKEEGIEEIYDDFYETSVMAIIRGEEIGETILLRADMDAIMVNEETEIEYASKNLGVMHACGHDAHITWMLGTAIILNRLKENIKGNIKILFQPAEEVIGGADFLLSKRNILKEDPKVSYVLAGHIWPEIEGGKIGIVNGCAMAAANFFTIDIKGKGGHAANPHKNIDPIAIGNLVYTAIQNIISRQKDPTTQGVISIGKFIGNGTFNIIPNSVTMEGTIRAESIEELEDLCEKIKLVLEGVCKGFGAEYKFTPTRSIPSVINDNYLLNIAIESGRKVYGNKNTFMLNKGSMTAEDFSYYLEEVPGLFAYIGNKNESKGIIAPLHNSLFEIDDDILWKASEYFSVLAIDILRNINK